jgi:hypothetical protein
MAMEGSSSIPASTRKPQEAGDAAGHHWGMTLALGLVQLGPAFILIVLMIVLGLLSPYFLTVRNMQNLGAQTATTVSRDRKRHVEFINGHEHKLNSEK